MTRGPQATNSKSLMRCYMLWPSPVNLLCQLYVIILNVFGGRGCIFDLCDLLFMLDSCLKHLMILFFSVTSEWLLSYFILFDCLLQRLTIWLKYIPVPNVLIENAQRIILFLRSCSFIALESSGNLSYVSLKHQFCLIYFYLKICCIVQMIWSQNNLI